MARTAGNDLTIDDVYVYPGRRSYADFCLLVGELHSVHGLSAKVQDDGPAGYAVGIMHDGTYTVVSNLDVPTWRGWLFIDEPRYFDGIDHLAEFKTNLLVSETDIALTASAIANAYKAMYADLDGPQASWS